MPTLPKQDRPAREGARVASVETGLAAAAAKLAQQVSLKHIKQQICTRKKWWFIKYVIVICMVLLWFRRSKSPQKESTPKSSDRQPVWHLLHLSRLSHLHPHHHLPLSLLETSAPTGEWTTTQLVYWTMNTQLDQDRLALAAPEAREQWPLVCSSLHADPPFLHRTAALILLHHLQH